MAKVAVDEETKEKAENFLEAAGAFIDKDDHLYRSMTTNTNRDLTLVQQERMQKIAVFLWESNLLADRIIELPLAFILSDGIKLTVPDPDLQKVLDRFWSDPVNRMNLTLEEKARELSIFGEQVYPAFVNDVSGAVRLGGIDPCQINTVIMDPDNAQVPIGITTKKDSKGNCKRYKVIINAEEKDAFTESTQRIRESYDDGEVFYFHIRRLSNGSRGRSDLLPQADWLDAYDQFLFGELDRSDQLRTFIWDVLLKGADQDAVDKRAKEISKPADGETRVHNENEIWSAISPDLNSTDTSNTAKLIRNHILGGASLPEHWFGGGGDVNRSTAGEMDEPTFKIMAMRQRRIRYMLEFIGTYVLRKHLQAKKPQDKIDLDHVAYQVVCEVPDMVQRDTTKYASALQQVVVAMAAAINAKIATKEFAIKLLTQTAKRLGVECEAEDLAKDLECAMEDQEEDDLPTDEDLEVV